MDKNSVIGFVLIAAILFGFSFFQSRRAKEYQALQEQQDSVALANKISELVDSQVVFAPDSLVVASDSVASPAPSIYKDSLLELAASAQEEIITLENNKLKVAFSTRGAKPNSVLVKDYYNYDSTALYLFKPESCEYNISIYTGEFIRTEDFTFVVASKTDSSVTMRLPFAGGGYIEQRWVLYEDSYCVDNQLSFVGMSGVIPKNVSSFDLDFNLTMPRMEKGYKNESQYSKLDYYLDGEKKPVEFGRGRNGSKRIDSKVSWFAYQQQFFSAIMRAPEQFSAAQFTVSFAGQDDPDRNLMTCSAAIRQEFKNGADVIIPYEFYFGPNHFQTLKKMDQHYEKIIPLGGWLVGWFTQYAIIPMFNWFSRFFSSFGLIILLMTIVIKIVVFPLTYKSLASSAKMMALKPEVEKINAKYPHTDNQQEMLKKNQATMDLYKRAGASPMGGCLPTLLTFPILWAMFRFFPASIELRQQSFLWCHDLSAYDSILDYGTRIPLLGDHLSLFALLMAVTMWFYSKMTMSSQPGANDPNAASMRFMSVWMMPIMMFFICNNLSAALSYYYLLSQLIMMLQTWLVRKSINPQDVLEKVRKSEGKPMPKSKWQQRLEAAQKMQEQQMKQQAKNKR